jgi:hypothetical protein
VGERETEKETERERERKRNRRKEEKDAGIIKSQIECFSSNSC